MAKGKVYLIGAGPGRPDLITVRGLNILKQADVVIYDYLVNPRVLREVSPGVELICSDSLGKKKYADTFGTSQEKINQLMVSSALRGKRVVRLKNGDPLIFGRLSQELEALEKHKVEFEIVPGVTAACAAAAYTGIPLTDRRFSSSLAIVAGHEDPAKSKSSLDWKAIASLGTIVLYMAVENLSSIVDKLISAGRPGGTAALIVARAGSIDQKYVLGKLSNIAARASKAKIKPPAVAIIGEVVKLAENYNWFKKNKRIMFPGLSEERFFLSGNYFHLPLIEIEGLKDYGQLDHWIESLSIFNWLIFASRFGVEFFFKRLLAQGKDVRSLVGLKIAAVGQSTAKRLLDFGVRADLVPGIESSDGLVKALKKEKMDKQLIFMPRSDLADKGLEEKISKLGAYVISCVAYRNVMPKSLPDLDLTFFNEIMFTSPSTVRNFKQRYKKVPAGLKVKCIGNRTGEEFKREFRS